MKSYLSNADIDLGDVTPCVGVWIEILHTGWEDGTCSLSLPAWECGLKFTASSVPAPKIPSLPAWACGLKCMYHHLLSGRLLSLPAWECGLKLMVSDNLCSRTKSLPAWECGLKYIFYINHLDILPSLPAWECGLKFRVESGVMERCGCHSLRGSVD